MQQINLYQDEFRPRREVVTSGQVLIGLAALLAVLVLIGFWQGWRNSQLAAGVEALRQTVATREARVAELQQKVAQRKPDPRLVETVQKLERRVEIKRQVLAVLSGRSFGNTEGFVPQLTGLARQRIEGLWLTGLRLHAGGTRLDMTGNALKPELVPRYLQRLANEDVFAGTAFRTFRLDRSAERPAWIHFVLHSVSPEESGS